MIKQSPMTTAFGTAVDNTSAADGDEFFFPPWDRSATPLSQPSPALWASGLPGKCAPHGKQASHKQRNPSSRRVGTTSTTLTILYTIPTSSQQIYTAVPTHFNSWRVLAIHLTALVHRRPRTEIELVQVAQRGLVGFVVGLSPHDQHLRVRDHRRRVAPSAHGSRATPQIVSRHL